MATLYEDIQSAHGGTKYFIGAAVFAPEEGIFQIVDGQQRFTSLYILLLALRQRISDSGASMGPFDDLLCAERHVGGVQTERTLRLQPSLPYAKELFLAELSNLEHRKAETPPEERYFQALLTAKEFAGRLSPSEAGDFFKRVTDDVVFLAYTAQSMVEAIKVYSALNNRGRDLGILDQMKALLFQGGANEEEWEELALEWELFVQEYRKTAFFNDGEAFLRYFLLTEEGRQVPTSDLLGRFAGNQSYYADCRQSKDTIRKLTAYAGEISRLQSGSSGGVFADLVYLGVRGTQHLLPLLASRHLVVEDRHRVCSYVEGFVIAIQIQKRYTGKISEVFTRWAEGLRQRERHLGDFEQEMKRDLRAIWEGVSWEMISLDRMPKQKIRYLLAKAELRLCKIAGSAVSDVKSLLYSNNGQRRRAGRPSLVHDIEHIHRVNASSEADAGFGVDEVIALRDNICNLTLLETSLNRAWKNMEAAEKLVRYPDSSVLTAKAIGLNLEVGGTMRSALARISTPTTWTAEDAKVHGHELFKLLREEFLVD